MTESELLETIRNGENSLVEFKSEKVLSDDFAKEVVAFANHKGGKILLGVEDDGTISGVADTKIQEERILNICRDKIHYPVNPTIEGVNVSSGKKVLVCHIPEGIAKPYAFLHHSKERYYVRAGSQAREASKDELRRLYQASGIVHFDATPVSRTTIDDLDRRKFSEFYSTSRGINVDSMSNDQLAKFLVNAKLMTGSDKNLECTVCGILIFGKNPSRLVPQSGLKFAHYDSDTMDASKLVDIKELADTIPECIEQAATVIKNNFISKSKVRAMKRKDFVPGDRVIREAITNSLAHRDYTITAQVRVFMFSDRIEFRSPGIPPNTVTLESMKLGGFSVARNPYILNFLRDMGFVEKMGWGVPTIFNEMKKVSTKEPSLQVTGHDLVLTLFLD